MVFCNSEWDSLNKGVKCHNPYFNRWFSAIQENKKGIIYIGVTILILIDGFLQFKHYENIPTLHKGHNPYFNRWFSAIWLNLPMKER